MSSSPMKSVEATCFRGYRQNVEEVSLTRIRWWLKWEGFFLLNQVTDIPGFIPCCSRASPILTNSGDWTRDRDQLRKLSWTSMVAQWLRIRLLMQGTPVWTLVREDPTCCGAATEPACHNYWVRVLQLKSTHLEPVLHNKRSHRSEKPAHRKEE